MAEIKRVQSLEELKSLDFIKEIDSLLLSGTSPKAVSATIIQKYNVRIDYWLLLEYQNMLYNSVLSEGNPELSILFKEIREQMNIVKERIDNLKKEIEKCSNVSERLKLETIMNNYIGTYSKLGEYIFKFFQSSFEAKVAEKVLGDVLNKLSKIVLKYCDPQKTSEALSEMKTEIYEYLIKFGSK